MSPIYTDMHFKIMPRKKDRGRRPESEKINKNDRTSSVPQTCAEHERLQGPPHNTGAVAAARGWFTYIRLSTCREMNGEALCGAREEAGTVVDEGPPHNTGAVAAARGWFTYIRLSTCRETNGETLCGAREEAGTVVDEERSTGGSGCEVGTNVRNT